MRKNSCDTLSYENHPNQSIADRSSSSTDDVGDSDDNKDVVHVTNGVHLPSQNFEADLFMEKLNQDNEKVFPFLSSPAFRLGLVTKWKCCCDYHQLKLLLIFVIRIVARLIHKIDNCIAVEVQLMVVASSHGKLEVIFQNWPLQRCVTVKSLKWTIINLWKHRN